MYIVSIVINEPLISMTITILLIHSLYMVVYFVFPVPGQNLLVLLTLVLDKERFPVLDPYENTLCVQQKLVFAFGSILLPQRCM